MPIATRRLTASDTATAHAMFRMMGDVFEEPARSLSDAYVESLLAQPAFWAIAALDQGDVVGGLTAHALPMTRAEVSEVFLYDLAVRTDRQREGIGRRLVTELREAAAAQDITVMFVPADEEDVHALDFYRALGGEAAKVTLFTFE